MQGKREDQCVNFDCTVVFFGFIKFGREVLDIAAASIKPGVTADEIDRIVHEVRNNNIIIIIHGRFFMISNHFL